MFDADTVHRHVLANGLTVLLRRDVSAPVAAVVTYVKAGYFDETDDVAGIAHVLEHMFFKGTPSRGVGEIARETKASGGYLNAHTIYDHTAYYAVLPTDGFARGLEIQADAYANSLIDETELARELEVIIQEAKRKADSPSAVAVETLYEMLHDRHRIRRWRIGHEPALRGLTREKLLAFYRNHYRPRNTILAIAGDLDVDDVLWRVEQLYGQLSDAAVRVTPGDAEVTAAGFRYRELSGDIRQTHTEFGWRTPGSLHPDTPSLDLFALIMGSGRGSRLYRAVREQRLASSVSADNYTPTEIGVYVMSSEGPPERVREATAAMWHQHAEARDHGVEAAELDRVRRLFEGRWLRRLETMEGQANHLADWEALGDWRLGEQYFERMMTAAAEEVVDAARRHLSSDQTSLLVYRPNEAQQFAAGLDEARDLLDAPGPGTGPRRGPETGTQGPDAGHISGARSSASLERIDGDVYVFRTGGDIPVLVRQRRGAPITYLGVFSAAGAALEPDGVAGLSTVTARAMLKGTSRRSAEEIAYQSELLGGSIAPSVTSDSTGWTFSVPARRTAEAIELLADVVQHPRFDDAAVETERTIALSNLAELKDDMYRYPLRLATAAAYGTHPYGRGVLGSEQTLRALSADDVRRWHAQHVLEAPVALAVVGDVDDAEVAGLLGAAFSELRGAPATSVGTPNWPATMVEIVEPRERAQTALAVAFPGPSRRDVNRFVTQLLGGVASGLGGRFFEALREKRSLAYTVQAYPVERVGAGAFVAYIATSPEQEDEARTGLLAEFARLRDVPVSDDELDRAKVFALGTHAIAQQSGARVLGEMVDAWLFGVGLEELAWFETNVRAVTPIAMRDLAVRYFDPERRVEGIVRGKKK